ncbi:Pleckstrin -like proteiny domain-containing family A member 4 [Collichthys lucidus]|uniref:Pleckstrin-like proteiny domain-containing family A member 4 n=1 Tax=Collichthys lucidus TaxID=240159 RepID=A0A4U5VN62_COLLU|nr:Pleckstrin -like proteiny domain-containing family A member 4 [Collichthys lucidus]
MELEAANRRAQLVRMDDQDRVSQASSVATISYFPVMKDSSGLKLWKRRWFVLSNYCLFYYKGTQLVAQRFVFRVVQQCICSFVHIFSVPHQTAEKNLCWAAFLFQATKSCSAHHGNARTGSSPSSADTQEDMLGWVRALSQSASMEPDSSLNRTPSPPEFSRRRVYGPNQEEDSLPENTPHTQTEMMGTGSLTSRGQLGSRPHTPVGRVDIRPHDDSVIMPQTLYYAPASPNLEFKSTPTTPVTERWQNISKPPKSEPRETPPIRPLESDADAVLTRLCGCDKLLQSLSLELAQLQMDKDSVHCALEVSRLQLEEWKNQGPRAQEEALTQKALLQEELVTIRARMCDVSLEMDRVWSQYERMESELSVIRSHLQHICNFGVPQEQSQAQRELWMMEDILAGLKVNRDHFRFLLGLQRHHTFQPTSPHPGSPGSPTERLQSGLPMDVEQKPPVRPPLPQELQESHQSRDLGHGWAESPYEKVKMSEEEQIERMKRNQERMTNRKKPPLSTPGTQTQSQGLETREEAPFPLRVTRVVTAVLPTSLVARRVSVEDPPPELDNPLPEQIQPEMQQRLAEQSKKMLNKPPRRPDQMRSSAEMHQDQPVKKTKQQLHQGVLRSSKKESQSEGSRAESREASRNQVQEQAGNGSASLDVRVEERPSAHLTPDMDPDLCLTAEQREAKLRRVEHRESYHGNRSRGDNIRRPAELQLSSETSQDDDEKDGHVKKSKSQVRFGNKTQHKDHSGRTGVAKTKIKRPASPYHISSMTVYQKEGAQGFTSCRDGEEKKLEEPATDDNESDFSSSDLRAKWFLSTSQWQGFIPLQIPDIDSFCGEEISDTENQPACTDDVTDSNEMSSTVSESLEKMKENHSLFYKIACDISISDTDITKNDGNSNTQTSSRPDEEELLIAESVPNEPVHNVERSSNQENKDSSLHLSSNVNENGLSINSKLQDSTSETKDKEALNTPSSPSKEACAYEGIPQKECEDASGQEGQLEKVRETIHGAPLQDTHGDQALDESAKTGEEQKELEAKKVDQERSIELKKRSLSEESKERVQERGNNHSITPSSSERVIRSASFGKARVTVIRTSL